MVEINAKDGAKLLPDALRALDKARIKPTTINLREPSLDDVFLALTGHKAEEEVA
jgi:ABC-2 type transport system ATP-binding protein